MQVKYTRSCLHRYITVLFCCQMYFTLLQYVTFSWMLHDEVGLWRNIPWYQYQTRQTTVCTLCIDSNLQRHRAVSARLSCCNLAELSYGRLKHLFSGPALDKNAMIDSTHRHDDERASDVSSFCRAAISTQCDCSECRISHVKSFFQMRRVLRGAAMSAGRYNERADKRRSHPPPDFCFVSSSSWPVAFNPVLTRHRPHCPR